MKKRKSTKQMDSSPTKMTTPSKAGDNPSFNLAKKPGGFSMKGPVAKFMGKKKTKKKA